MLLPILHDNLVQYSLSLVDVQLHAKWKEKKEN